MYKDAQRLWERIISLFDYSKVETVLKEELPKAEMKTALSLILIAAVFGSLISVLTLLETMQLVNFSYDMASDLTVTQQPQITISELVPFILFQFLFNAPFFVVFGLVYEAISYGIIKTTGGRGTFTQQYHLSAIVMSALMLTSTLSFLLPLPCLQIFAFLGLLLLTLYFIFFVSVKAYGIVHDISFLHALTIVVILTVPRFVLLVTLTNEAAMLFGLPQTAGV
ncbi:hypothetical protein KKB44_01855 [Candidatus Micrarchaeota archaeon]|nr:hypothetical protein [Candidatus Micrarchaeota archaeon]